MKIKEKDVAKYISANKYSSVGRGDSSHLVVTPRTPLFEGKIPENQKTKISIRKGRLLLVNDQGFSQIPPT